LTIVATSNFTACFGGSRLRWLDSQRRSRHHQLFCCDEASLNPVKHDGLRDRLDDGRRKVPRFLSGAAVFVKEGRQRLGLLASRRRLRVRIIAAPTLLIGPACGWQRLVNITRDRGSLATATR
jgi:hypothetical protein